MLPSGNMDAIIMQMSYASINKACRAVPCIVTTSWNLTEMLQTFSAAILVMSLLIGEGDFDIFLAAGTDIIRYPIYR